MLPPRKPRGRPRLPPDKRKLRNIYKAKKRAPSNEQWVSVYNLRQIPRELWEQVKSLAIAKGVELREYILAAITEYTERVRAEVVLQPPPETPAIDEDVDEDVDEAEVTRRLAKALGIEDRSPEEIERLIWGEGE